MTISARKTEDLLIPPAEERGRAHENMASGVAVHVN